MSLPLPGPEKADCPCGCGLFGKPKKGLGHIRNCPCSRCQGGKNRRDGLSAQRVGKKWIEAATGISAGRYSSQTGNEENWRFPFRVEVKSGLAAQVVANKFIVCEAQSEESRPFGDSRVFVAVHMPPKFGGDGLLSIRLSQLKRFLEWREEQLA